MTLFGMFEGNGPKRVDVSEAKNVPAEAPTNLEADLGAEMDEHELASAAMAQKDAEGGPTEAEIIGKSTGPTQHDDLIAEAEGRPPQTH